MPEVTNVPRVTVELVVISPSARRKSIEEEGTMSEKPSDVKKLLDKMRTNTEKQNRKTEALPRRRTRKMAQKIRHKEEPEKQK